MFAYWLMYLIPAGFALSISGSKKQKGMHLWIVVGLAFIVLIGFRDHVGGDWNNYYARFQNHIGTSLDIFISDGSDIGYSYLSWLMADWGWGIYGVNLVIAILFVIGFITFCRQEAKPWLAFSVAVPYLIIVVVMGYARQGVAIGLFFWAISYIERGKFKQYIVLILIAALFHKTAVLMIPLGIFLYGKGRILRVIAVGLAAFGAWDLLLASHQDALWKNYIEIQMQSEGAQIRTFMNLVPSLLFLLYRKRWKSLFPNYWFWFWIAIGSILSFAFVGVASTAVDRIALYFIPIQVVVFSRLHLLMGKRISSSSVTAIVIIGYAAVLFVWLNYATHARYWIPYNNVIFQ